MEKYIGSEEGVPLRVFDDLYELHKRYRKRGRLSGKMNPVEYADEFILDAWEGLNFTDFDDGLEVGDVGSGSGYPGLPLYIFRPTISVKLVESNKRKVEYLKMVIRELGLSGAGVIPERAENVRCSFDVVVSKGFGVKILRLVNGLVRGNNGKVLIFGPCEGGFPTEIGSFRLERKRFYKLPSKLSERVIALYRRKDVSRET